MIRDLLIKSSLKDQIIAWRAMAAAGVAAFDNAESGNIAKATARGWTREDYATLLAVVDKADAELQVLEREQPKVVVPADDSPGAYIGSAPTLSMLQTIINGANEQAGLVEQAIGQGLATDQNGLSDQFLSDVAQPKEGLGFFYSAFDEPGLFYATEWVKAMAYRVFHAAHPFVVAGPTSTLAKKARLIIVGDWGTGVGRALDVANQMRLALDEKPDWERHVVHLGDIYFCGWPDEVKERFQDPWPVKAGEAGIRSWSLNGNHDMYAGGDGYFGMLAKDPRFAGQGGASYFSLGNEYWHILGLDSAYEEWSLTGNQVAWAQAERAKFPTARGILLSHHQPFSAYEGNEPGKAGNLSNAAAPLLKDGFTTLWLWGHEHRCVVYEPRQLNFDDGSQGHLPFGACLGHGGVPTQPTREKKAQVKYLLDKEVTRGGEKFGMMGFAILDLDGPVATFTCVDENGNRGVFIDENGKPSGFTETF